MSDARVDVDSHPQHDGPCCSSCLQDEVFDSIYSLWPKCCCRAINGGDDE